MSRIQRLIELFQTLTLLDKPKVYYVTTILGAFLKNS